MDSWDEAPLLEEAKAIVEKGPTSDDAYKKQLDHYLSRMSEFRESRLAQYVIHRKCILEILRKRLEIQSGRVGKIRIAEVQNRILNVPQRGQSAVDLHGYRSELVAQPQVKRQRRGHMNVVLDVGSQHGLAQSAIALGTGKFEV